ncbi:MAG: heme NO-binding domain-containing protein [Bernardetiaceae bacterium]|nr:heme NO-binding domain-containing protein [Bernardetiaceae bacterium]
MRNVISGGGRVFSSKYDKKQTSPMKGTIHRCLGEMITEQFGESKWQEVLKATALPEDYRFTKTEDIDEHQSLQLITNSSTILKKPLSEIFDLFGVYWVCHYAPREYKFWYIGLKDAKDFILKLDNIHSLVGKHFNKAKPPNFIYTEENKYTLLVQYKSKRNLIDLYISLVKGVATYFKEDIEIEKLSESEIRLTFLSLK